MRKGEPPSPSGRTPAPFLVGKNSCGNWVVQDRSHRCGGLFANRKDALKFALLENGNRPQAVVMVADVLEFDMSEAADPASASRAAAYPTRRAA